MENHNVQMGGSSGSSTAANSRWNPTKEQISMLENLYKQGVRTPSAEQIQQITTRLRAYGHIEGKNVFYWFQNHKARQRQKQKQESIAYFNRFLHRSPPIFPSPLCPNVLCAPYYQLPQNEMQFYPQHPKVLLPSSPRRRPRSSEQVVPLEMPRYSDAAPVYEHMHHPTPNNIAKSDHETLALFPLQPTGILEAKTMDKDSPFSAVSADNSAATHSGSSDIDGEDGLSGNQPLIDFFSSGQAS